MLKDISGIKITGGAFVDNTFDFFGNNKEMNVSIIYGKNGSGKSTIARAFRKIKGEETADIDKASIINKEGTEIQLDSIEKNNIYIFDEKFVNDEIGLKEEGIDTNNVITKINNAMEKEGISRSY